MDAMEPKSQEIGLFVQQRVHANNNEYGYFQ